MPTPKPALPSDIRSDIERLMSELFPVYRTLMGRGFEESLDIISKTIPVRRHAIPSGTQCGSWKIPDEWILDGATLENSAGEVIVDHSSAPFMVWQYSEATDTRVPLETLLQRVAVGPESVPGALPLVVTYYRKRWGLSLSAEQAKSLPKDEYRVRIDARFKPGNLTIGSIEIPGRKKDTILIDAVLSCAALANNLSGVAAAAILGGMLSKLENPNFSYRILFTPETLGPIATHFHIPSLHSDVVGGLTLGNLGYGNGFTYRRSRQGDSPVDRAVEHVMTCTARTCATESYDVRTGTCGNEKAYNSLGIEVPVGALRRAPLGSYAKYDTSADDLDFVSSSLIEDALAAVWEIVYCLEHDAVYKHSFEGEPFLTGYGIFPASDDERYYFDYLMGFADGQHTLLQIANMAQRPIWRFEAALRSMEQQGLLRCVPE